MVVHCSGEIKGWDMLEQNLFIHPLTLEEKCVYSCSRSTIIFKYMFSYFQSSWEVSIVLHSFIHQKWQKRRVKKESQVWKQFLTTTQSLCKVGVNVGSYRSCRGKNSLQHEKSVGRRGFQSCSVFQPKLLMEYTGNLMISICIFIVLPSEKY